jgi:hypothetical protein
MKPPEILTRANSHDHLGTSMVHHIRRLLMTPLAGFDGELASHGGAIPATVVAASKCLAICIEVSDLEGAYQVVRRPPPDGLIRCPQMTT